MRESGARLEQSSEDVCTMSRVHLDQAILHDRTTIAQAYRIRKGRRRFALIFHFQFRSTVSCHRSPVRLLEPSLPRLELDKGDALAASGSDGSTSRLIKARTR